MPGAEDLRLHEQGVFLAGLAALRYGIVGVADYEDFLLVQVLHDAVVVHLVHDVPEADVQLALYNPLAHRARGALPDGHLDLRVLLRKVRQQAASSWLF